MQPNNFDTCQNLNENNYKCLLSALLNQQKKADKPKTTHTESKCCTSKPTLAKSMTTNKRAFTLNHNSQSSKVKKSFLMPKLVDNSSFKKQSQLPQTKRASTITTLRQSRLKSKTLSHEDLDKLIAQSSGSPGRRLCELIKRSKSAESASPTRQRKIVQKPLLRPRSTPQKRQSDDEFELIEKFFSSSTRGLTLEQKRAIFAQIVQLVAAVSKQEQLSRAELESIVSAVREEISALKVEMNEKKRVQPLQSDLDEGFKRIVTNYSNNLADMQTQLDEIASIKPKGGYSVSRAQQPLSIDDLQNELSQVYERNRLLQIDLDEKNKQLEKYSELFSDLKENISVIIKDLGEQETTGKYKLLSIQTSLSSRELTKAIKSNGTGMFNPKKTSAAKNHTYQYRHNYASHIQPSQQPAPSTVQLIGGPPKIEAAAAAAETAGMAKKRIVPSTATTNNDSSTTSLDTLFDADLSFNAAPPLRSGPVTTTAASAASFIKPIPVYVQQPLQSQPPPMATTAYVGVASPNKLLHPKNNRFHDDEHDDEKIIINMDELSLTSLVSLEHNDDEVSSSEDSIQVFQQHQQPEQQHTSQSQQIEIFSTVNNMEAKRQQQPLAPNQHIHHHHFQHQQHQVDDQFESDLKALDQKIFKVKQMLDSMKSS